MYESDYPMTDEDIRRVEWLSGTGLPVEAIAEELYLPEAAVLSVLDGGIYSNIQSLEQVSIL
jgi:hypothetical protein